MSSDRSGEGNSVSSPQITPFQGWRVVGAAFVLATFGWGLGLYGPPVYLHAVREARGWPLSLISAAITTHFLSGAAVVACLPAIHRRLGIPMSTRIAGIAVGVGVVGWAWAQEPWQMFTAAVISGIGWAGTSAAAVNAILAPWFARERPKALALAYNGASFGGIVFQPVWVAGLQYLGFATSAVLIAVVTMVTIWVLAGLWFASTPHMHGQHADGAAPPATLNRQNMAATPVPLPGRGLGASLQFRTLCLGTAASLFAQTGLLVLLFSHMVPALGTTGAGWTMTGTTVAAMAGRTAMSIFIRPSTDRRQLVALAVLLQFCASLILLAAGGTETHFLVAGALLFGLGLGNAVSLPPLIAQAEFASEDVPRVVSLTVATSQATYAFAPAVFALLIEWPMDEGGGGGGTSRLFIGAAVIQAVSIAIYLYGRRRR
jgi:MFS family permease